MKKKWISLIAAGVMAVCMLTACGSKDAEKKEPVPTQEASGETTPAPTVSGTDTPVSTEGTDETVVILGQYKGLTLYEVESSVVAEEIMELLESYGDYVTVNRAAEENDAVNINYVGTKDGVAFEGGTDDSEEGYDLVLGSDSFIDGFEDGLVGAVAGEVRTLDLTFSESYHNQELAGQKVVFTVTVNAVKEWTVPELTDAFVAENFDYETTAEFILALYDSLNQNSFYEQISNELMNSCQIENFPQDKADAQKQEIVDYYTSYADYFGAYYGLDTETALAYLMGFSSLEALNSYAEEYANELVKNELIMGEIFAKELTEEDYQTRLQQYLTYFNLEEQELYDEYGGEESVRQQIQSELVFEYIISEASIVEAEENANAGSDQ